MPRVKTSIPGYFRFIVNDHIFWDYMEARKYCQHLIEHTDGPVEFLGEHLIQSHAQWQTGKRSYWYGFYLRLTPEDIQYVTLH